MVLYDNEEVGSRSLMGADSTLLSDVFQAIAPEEEHQRMARQKSLLLSCVSKSTPFLKKKMHRIRIQASINHNKSSETFFCSLIA